MRDAGPLPRPGAAFVGRGSELADLRSEAGSAWQGHGRLVVIEGPPGIGKTRLVAEALRDHPGELRRGQADQLRGRRAFGVVVDALGIDLRRAGIGRLLPEVAVPDAGGEGGGAGGAGRPAVPTFEFRVAEALLHHVGDLAATGALTVVLEDLQWADPSTMVFLHLLEGHLARWPLLVVATHRPVEHAADAEGLLTRVGERDGSRLVLGPLGDDDITALARDALGGEPGPHLRAHLAGASGNPLFAIEILDALARGGELRRAPDGTIEVPPRSLPAPLARLMLSRLGSLPRETFELLQLAAVLGSRFPAGPLSQLAGLSTFVTGTRLRPALAAGVIVTAGHDFAFRHEAVRDSLYLDLPEPLRVRLHVDAATALAAGQAPPEQVAEHLLRGASPDDPSIVGVMTDVATGLKKRAPSVAADVLQRALELVPDRPTRQRLLAQRADALWRAGRLPEAEVACRALLTERPDPWARLLLTQILLAQTRLTEALTVSDAGAVVAEASGVVQARLLAWSAVAGVYSGEVEEALPKVEAAEAAATETGDRFTEVVVLAAKAALAHTQGRFAEAIKAARRGLWLQREPSGDEGHLPLELLVAAVLFDAGRLSECRTVLAAALTDCAERGSRWELSHCHGLGALVNFVAGWWDDARAEIEAAAVVAGDLGTRGYTLVGQAVLARIALHRGDMVAARAALTAADEDLARWGSEPRLDWVGVAWAHVLDAEGRAAEAMEAAWQAWRMCSAAGIRSEFPAIGPDVVRFCLSGGDPSKAAEVVAALDGLAGVARAPVVEAAFMRARGLLEGDAKALGEVGRRYADQGRPWESARATEEAGGLLVQAGNAGAGRTLLEEALAGYERLGARHDAGRTTAALRRLGVRRRRASAERATATGRPTQGWESLTPTQEAVVALVAEGLSNRQIAERLFISRHTVHTHVSHILVKLGLASRVELAREAGRRAGH